MSETLDIGRRQLFDTFERFATNHSFLVLGGSVVTRLKLEGIHERAPGVEPSTRTHASSTHERTRTRRRPLLRFPLLPSFLPLALSLSSGAPIHFPFPPTHPPTPQHTQTEQHPQHAQPSVLTQQHHNTSATAQHDDTQRHRDPG